MEMMQRVCYNNSEGCAIKLYLAICLSIKENIVVEVSEISCISTMISSFSIYCPSFVIDEVLNIDVGPFIRLQLSFPVKLFSCQAKYGK